MTTVARIADCDHKHALEPPGGSFLLKGREHDDVDVLRSGRVGPRIMRGSAMRTLGYGISVLLGLVASILLLRHLGVSDFGRYVTVTALLGIVGNVADLGLTATGSREMAVAGPGPERHRVLSSLLGLRATTGLLGVAGAVGFAAVVGYDRVMIAGAALLGVGVILAGSQAMMSMPLWISMRVPMITALDLLRSVLTVAGIAALVALGAGLLPFFVIAPCVAAIVLFVTSAVVGNVRKTLRSFDLTRARALIREAAPIGIASVMYFIYFGSLVIVVSLVGNETQTGLYGTAFRIYEVILGLPALMLGIALPFLSVVAQEDEQRLKFSLQRISEVALVIGVLLALLIAILANEIVRLLGGAEYEGAGPVLRIQAAALVPIFLSQAWGLGLIALRLHRPLVISSCSAFVVVVTMGIGLVPIAGAEGAAWAAVTAEILLAVLAYVFLGTARQGIRPDVRPAWKVAIAAGCGVATLAIPVDSSWAHAALAGMFYAAAALGLGAVPRELITGLLEYPLAAVGHLRSWSIRRD